VDSLQERLREIGQEINTANRSTRLSGAIEGSTTQPTADQLWQVDRAWEQVPALIEKVKGDLDEHVQEVRMTNRLTDSPACLVSDEHGMSPYLEKVLRASGQDVPVQKRILELNPDHVVVKKLQEMVQKDSDAEDVQNWSQLLFDQALVAEGNLPSDPAAFARSITKLMQKTVD
jgi:molecular chaperone HtpG